MPPGTVKRIYRAVEGICRTVNAIDRTVKEICRAVEVVYRAVEWICRTVEAVYRTADLFYRTVEQFCRAAARGYRAENEDTGGIEARFLADRRGRPSKTLVATDTDSPAHEGTVAWQCHGDGAIQAISVRPVNFLVEYPNCTEK